MDKTKRIELANNFDAYLKEQNQKLEDQMPMHYYPITALGVISWLDKKGYLRENPFMLDEYKTGRGKKVGG